LEGQIPNQKKPDKKNNAQKGRLSLQGVRLHRLTEALGISVDESLKGTITLDLPFTHAPGEQIPTGQGTLRFAGVRWKDTIIAEQLRGEISISPQQLRLRNFGGALADGTLNAQFAYAFQQVKQSWLVIAMDNVETSKLFAPWLHGKIEGPMHARIRGNFADGWRGSAELELTRGKVAGFDVSQWRIPASWSYSPSQNRGEVTIVETTAQVARGRATGKLTVHLETAARIEGGVRFSNVDVQDFLRQTIGPSQLGGGKMTGRIDFSGDHVRSLDDIGADIDASFSQAQALQLPVLKQIAPFLGVGATTTFQKGKLVAKLSRGVVRVQNLFLQGNNVQVYADGNITLEGRLNLDVLAKTRDFGLPTDRLRILGLRVPIAGPVPLVVIQEVSAFLSNRLIYLQVTGTARSPVIRPRPVAILAQEAIRFFMNRYNLPVSAFP
jgi:hypothetical protein